MMTKVELQALLIEREYLQKRCEIEDTKRILLTQVELIKHILKK